MQDVSTSTSPVDGQRQDLFTVPEAANYLAIKPRTLDVWRSTKRVQIPFVRVGAAIRYRRIDLDAFIESRRVAA